MENTKGKRRFLQVSALQRSARNTCSKFLMATHDKAIPFYMHEIILRGEILQWYVNISLCVNTNILTNVSSIIHFNKINVSNTFQMI
jgi:hypothetical protein